MRHLRVTGGKNLSESKKEKKIKKEMERGNQRAAEFHLFVLLGFLRKSMPAMAPIEIMG